MSYKDHQRVRVSLSDKEDKGIILSKSDFIGSNGWFFWVQVGIEVSLYSEEKLDELNARGPCTCGSKATGQPSHSHYCDVNSYAM